MALRKPVTAREGWRARRCGWTGPAVVVVFVVVLSVIVVVEGAAVT